MLAAAMAIGVLTSAAQEKVTLKDTLDKVSYSIGVNIGTTLKQQGLDLKPEILAAGIRDVLSNSKTQLTEDEMRETLMTFQRDMAAKQAEQGDKNKKAGETFLLENKKKQGIVTLPSGLQYKIVREGKGQKPKATDVVKTHYRGTLIDGTQFDSSTDGDPVSFPLNEVIRGWTEALQLMPVGSKWQLFIPSELAYGPRGQGPIPPNSTLVFEIELLGIETEKK